MGANMARRLKDCGYAITAIYDRRPTELVALAIELDAKVCTTLKEVTARADIIFTVVSDDAAQLGIFAESGDSLLAGATGKVFVNCATVSPGTQKETARRTRHVGAEAIEAGMASSTPQARTGALYLMCAGDEATFARVRPVLEKLSSALRFVGPAGRAAQVKVLVNMVMNSNTAALAEGLGLGQALGLDLDQLREIFAQTGANSQVLKTDGEDMQHRAHDCFFSAAHAAKDSGIAHQMALDAGLNLPLAAATQTQFARLVSLGLGGLDKSGVAELTFKNRHG